MSVLLPLLPSRSEGLMEYPVLVVTTNAVPGKEAEFNDWYDNVHVPHMMKLDGFVSVRRYQATDVLLPGEEPPARRFLAIYTVEPGRVLEAAKALTDAWPHLASLAPGALDRTAGSEHLFYSPLETSA